MPDNRQTARYLSLRRALMEQTLCDLNERQREAVLATEGPLLILAGAGSGKTTVLIRRIAHLLTFGRGYQSESVPFYVTGEDIDFLQDSLNKKADDSPRLRRLLAEYPPNPWEILAITFTNKAAGELRARLCSMLGEEAGQSVAASTFHSACVRMLRADINLLGYQSGFTIYDADDAMRVVKGALKELNLDEKSFAPRAVLAAVGEAKDRMESPGAMLERAKKSDDWRLTKIAALYARYQTRLKEANALDFDDLIMLAVRLLQEHPDVLEKYRRRYRYIMVDEYQDTNRSQYLLVSLLAQGCRNLCVVGDDDQSIYRFRGATIENILSFERQFENARVIRLEQNYRSTRNILDAANHVIAHNEGRKGKTLWTQAGPGRPVCLYRAADERDEANFIADAIASSVREGNPYSRHAVLYRINAQSQSLESALISASIPYRVIGGTRFFDRKEIKDVIAYLSILHNRSDALRLLRIVNEPKRGIGEATVAAAQEIASMLGIGLLEVFSTADQYAPLSRKASSLMEFAGMMAQLSEAAQRLPIDELIDEVTARTGYRAMLEAEGFSGVTRLENIEELKTTAQRYLSESEQPSLGGFLEEVALYTDLDGYSDGDDAVVLMTLHAAKGLEFAHVFIPGMEEGLFPSSRSFNDPSQLEEERRLAYVGVTRAKESLTLLTAARRTLFGQTLYGRESRFIEEIPETLLECRKAASSPLSSRAGTRGERARPSEGFGAARQQAPQQSVEHPVSTGDRVLHRVFGEGTVLSASPMGGDRLLEVRFDRVGVKKIMEAYARLTKL